MKLKVCGLKDQENIMQVVGLSPDFVGFIFYEKSLRYVGELSAEFVKKTSGPVKVGVFVNASIDQILGIKESYGLDMVQLHGEESLAMVQDLKRKNISVIKVFRVLDELPNEMDDYAPHVDLFLFDTRSGKKYGGSGMQFDWSILRHVNHPFLLSGGIGMEDLEQIRELKLKYLVGLDINSRVEVSPGIKDIQKIKSVKAML